MTVFVGCPEGCRFHTALAVYDLVSIDLCVNIWTNDDIVYISVPHMLNKILHAKTEQ